MSCGLIKHFTISICTIAVGTSVCFTLPDDITQKILESGNSRTANLSDNSRTGSTIDNSLDSLTYFVGMGDAFDVTVVDLPSIRYRATVNQNCDIMVSELGVLKLGRLNLADTREALRRFVGARLRKGSEVYVAMSQGKNASVTVAGDVAKPGTYSLSGTLRVLDAISTANGNELPKLEEYDYRAVECRIGDSSFTLDLIQAMFAGRDEGNPYLYPGMRIVLRKATRRVLVLGEIKGPITGLFPIRADETLASLVTLLTLNESVDSSRITVQSGFTQDARGVQSYSFDQAATVQLRDMDIVTFLPKSDYPRLQAVYVRGEVKRSASIPVIAGRTTARQAVDMCGGTTEWAAIDQTVIIRHSKLVTRSLREGAAVNGIAEPPQVIHATVRPEISTSFQRMNILNDYIVIPVGKNGGMDTPLEGEDHVFVPRKDNFVYISGSVERPGAYEYVEGKSYGYYVEKAGGYSRRGSRANTYAMSQYGPAVAMKPPSDLDPGDVLVVPDREEHKFLRTLFLPVLQAVATTVTAIVAIISVTR